MKAADYQIGYFDRETQQYVKEFSGMGFIFKDCEAFGNKSAGVCYISSSCEKRYTAADFIRIAKGNIELTDYLFYSVDSERPELLFDQLVCHDVIEEDGTLTQIYKEKCGSFPDIPYWF